jgi:hypothetical protein
MSGESVWSLVEDSSVTNSYSIVAKTRVEVPLGYCSYQGSQVMSLVCLFGVLQPGEESFPQKKIKGLEVPFHSAQGACRPYIARSQS